MASHTSNTAELFLSHKHLVPCTKHSGSHPTKNLSAFPILQSAAMASMYVSDLHMTLQHSLLPSAFSAVPAEG